MIYLLYSYFKQNQCLNIKKHDVHNIYRLAWAFCAPPRPPPGEMPIVPMRSDVTGSNPTDGEVYSI